MAYSAWSSSQSLKLYKDSLDQHQEIARARTHLEVHKLALATEERLFADMGLLDYMDLGGALPGEQKEIEKAMSSFGIVLNILHVVFQQYQFGMLDDSTWKRVKQQICILVTSSGGEHFFSISTKYLSYDKTFNKLISTYRVAYRNVPKEERSFKCLE